MTARTRYLLPSLLALSLSCMSLHAQQTIELQQKMGAADFQQAGLDKLSGPELQHLQQWLAAHAADLAATVPASEAVSANQAASKRSGWFGRGGEKAADSNRTVTSPVEGNFNGWRPGTTLTLQNGQKWRVVDDSSLTVNKVLDAPVVTIKPGAFGSWTLKVEGYNTSAKVAPAN